MPPSPDPDPQVPHRSKLDARGWRRVKAPSPAARAAPRSTHGARPADYALFPTGSGGDRRGEEDGGGSAECPHPGGAVRARLADSPYDFEDRVRSCTRPTASRFGSGRAQPGKPIRRVADFHTPEALARCSRGTSTGLAGACSNCRTLASVAAVPEAGQHGTNGPSPSASAAAACHGHGTADIHRRESGLPPDEDGRGQAGAVPGRPARLGGAGGARVFQFRREPGQKFNQVYEVYSNRFQRETSTKTKSSTSP